MADFLLYRRGPKSAKLKTVTMRFTHNRDHFERSTGVNVTERDWDETKGRVRSKVAGAAGLNRKIEVVRDRFATAASRVEKAELELTTETFRAAYELLMEQVEMTGRNLEKIELTRRSIEEDLRADIARLSDELAHKQQQLIRMLNPQGTSHKLLDRVIGAYAEASREDPFAESTLANYERTKRFYTCNLPGVTVDELTAKLLTDLRDKLVKEGKRNSSIRIRFQHLKAALKHYAEEIDSNYDLKFLSKVKVGAIKKDKPSIYLTPSELAVVEEVDLVDPRLAYVRDLFLLSCYTGLRHVDLQLNETQHIHEDYVSLFAQKTKRQNDLPFSKKARTIYQRLLATDYEYKWQKVGNYTRLVQQVCEKVTLLHKEEPLSLDKNDPRTKPKYQLISSKAGRKTFINNCLLKNVRMDVVAGWVGHQSLEMIQNHYASKKAQSEAERWKIEEGF
jgi:integrase